MNIAIVGVGGVGGYIGAQLCKLQPEHHITFIARGAHAQAIATDGLEVIEDDSRYRVHPDAVTDSKTDHPPFDLIFLCVKSYDILEAIDDLKQAITPDTIILPIANGVNHAETVRAAVQAKVLNAAVYILSHIQAPGSIRKKGKTFALIFGAPGQPETVETLNPLLESAGLRYKTPEKIEEAVWKKYIFIATFANLTSYYDLSIHQVERDHPAETLQLLEEIARIGAAKGLDLSGDVTKAIETARSLPEDASTSMHLDFQRGNRTELETLSGYLVREAQTHQIDLPLLNKIYTSLKEKKHG